MIISGEWIADLVLHVQDAIKKVAERLPYVEVTSALGKPGAPSVVCQNCSLVIDMSSAKDFPVCRHGRQRHSVPALWDFKF